MKTSIVLNIIALMSLTTAAQASYFQINCSNADGTIMTGSGHGHNFVQLTKYSSDQNGSKQETIRFERGTVQKQDTLKTVKLLEESKQSCRKPGEGGYASHHAVSASVVTFMNADGSLFDGNVMGVSKDRKTVKAELICETNVNNIILCPKN